MNTTIDIIEQLNLKPIDVKDSAYINIDKEVNDNDPKFKVGDHVRISKYKNPNWSEEVFAIKEIKNTVPWTYVVNDFNNEEIIENFYKKNCKR